MTAPLMFTAFECVPAFGATGTVFLKGTIVAVLKLDDPALPSEIYRFSSNISNSGIAVAQTASVAAFSDGRLLQVLGRNGVSVASLDLSGAIGSGWETNWELALDENGGIAWVSALECAEASRTIRVLRTVLSGGDGETPTEIAIDYPDSGAYQISSRSESVLYLSSDFGGQDLVVATARNRRRYSLKHRFNWARIAPRSDRVVLSRAIEPGPIAVVSIGEDFSEAVLPVEGYAAGWAGEHHVLYHSLDGSLQRYYLHASKAEPLIALSRPLYVNAESVVPATSDDSGNIIAWPWIASDADGAQRSGTAVISLREKAVRCLDSYWFRLAIAPWH